MLLLFSACAGSLIHRRSDTLEYETAITTRHASQQAALSPEFPALLRLDPQMSLEQFSAEEASKLGL